MDGHTDGTTPVGGVAASVRVSRVARSRIEGELTGATREIARSYEGTFVSYAPPGSTSREEFERFAPRARRTLAYVPHLGVAAMVVARTAINARVGLAGRLGVASRGYSERSSYVVLSIPEGVDPARVARDFQPQTVETVRGGLLLGVDVDLGLTPRFTLPLQMRVRLQRPGRIGQPAPRSRHRRQRTLAVLTRRRYGCGFGVAAGAPPVFSRLLERALDRVVDVRRHRMVAPQPAHHVRQDRAALLLAVLCRCPTCS